MFQHDNASIFRLVELLFRMREGWARLNAMLPPESAGLIRSMGTPATALVRSSSTELWDRWSPENNWQVLGQS
jgi:hypothetical protein